MFVTIRYDYLVVAETQDAVGTAGQQCPLRRIGRDLIRSQPVSAEQCDGRFGKLDRHGGAGRLVADHECMAEAEQHQDAVRRDDPM